MSAPPGLVVRGDIAEAVAAGGPVVALESTLVAHGLPRPRNLTVARDVERLIRDEGAVPATVAVLDGRPTIGLDDEQLQRIASGDGVLKLGVRDLPSAAAAGATGATTVASTAHLAALAGIEVFATGGLGGVHRHARDSWDESADLPALARTPILVVCAGVKSILDVAATLQRLETLGVPVVGYGTTSFPGFYLSSSGHHLAWRVDDAASAARLYRARSATGVDDRALVLALPLAETEQLDRALHDRVLAEALRQLDERTITGTAVTPFLLDHFHRETGGRSLAVNVTIIRNNARLASQVAGALARASGTGG